jgi:hypothetical protein
MEDSIMAKISEMLTGNIYNRNGLITDSQGSIIGGKILQVKTYNNSSEITISSNTWADLYSLDFTPLSANSSILLTFSCSVRFVMDKAQGIGFRFNRGGNDLDTVYEYEVYRGGNSAGGSNNDPRLIYNKTFIDTPNTTSTITYKIRTATYNSKAVKINEGGKTSAFFTIMEIGG